MTKVEEVARALCILHRHDPDEVVGILDDGSDWFGWSGFEDEARAAIRAMRLPSAGMVEAMDAIRPMYDDPITTGEEYWQAAIDAALQEGE